jgi:hypothetical protein
MHHNFPDIVTVRGRPPNGLLERESAQRASEIGSVPRFAVVAFIKGREQECYGERGLRHNIFDFGGMYPETAVAKTNR